MYSKIAGFSKRATSSTTLEKPFEANIYHSAAAGKTGHRIQLFPEKLPLQPSERGQDSHLQNRLNALLRLPSE